MTSQGIVNPDMVVMDAPRAVTANFSLNTGPPLIGNIEVSPHHNWALVRWVTNEPGTSRTDYGLTSGYGDVVEDLTFTDRA